MLSPIEPGIHGLSNQVLDSPWSKVTYGKGRLSDILQLAEAQPSTTSEELIAQLMDLLSNQTR